MRTLSLLILFLGCFGLLVLGSGGPADSWAQQTEICDNGKDDDKDKLVDCDDPDCSKECDGGEACSPGYWKNHPEDWWGICCDGDDQLECETIDDLLRARGPGSSMKRAFAADILEDCAGQPCNDD